MPEDIAAICRTYRHDVVRDLVWAIASPPLMQPDGCGCQWFDEAWYFQRYLGSETWLRALDADPAPLLTAVAEQKDRRLGNYFETLWAFWLEADQRYDLIVRNLPVREGGDTLGELDFVVRDNQTGLNYHWELAVKFYLGVDDTAQMANWHGPGKRDRLDIKLNHLKKRQSQMCELPQTQALLREKGIEITGCAVILKGRLFYPGSEDAQLGPPREACTHHLRGNWFHLSEFCARVDENDRFLPLVRSGWMADHGQADDAAAEAYRWSDVEAAIQRGMYRLPLCLMWLRGGQLFRLFLVPDEW